MKKLAVAIIIIYCIILAGCESCNSNKARCNEGIHIAAINGPGTLQRTGSIRLAALQEAATTVGAQGGLAWRSEQINCILKRQQFELDQVYNFRALMLKDDIRPPVLEDGRKEMTLDACDVVRAADHIYRIILPPCFVSAPPNWRDYIWMRFCTPESPDGTLLPRCTEEAALWNCFVKIGWQKGIEQANLIFAENLARLNRDYNGMILYRNLLAQNMVTPPYVAKTELGVTGDANELRINDRVLRISATSQLNPNADTWRPVIAKTKPEDVCRAIGPLAPLQNCPTIRRDNRYPATPKCYTGPSGR